MDTVVLSDIHAGPGLGPWEWIDSAGVDRLEGFLAKIAGHVGRIVLAGDVWDSWMIPHDVTPPSTQELLGMGPAARVVGLIRDLAAAGPVVYVRGNHDDRMTPELLAQVLPGVEWGGDAYHIGQIRIEHGHLHALFCALDPDVPDGVPLGYFVSRLTSTADRDTGGHSPTRAQVVQGLLDAAVTSETLPQALLEVMAKRAGVGMDATIAMPSDMWGGRAVTLREVSEAYRDLRSRWERRHGVVATAVAIPAEVGHLEPAADELLLAGERIVIMGHTHIACGVTVLGRTYANSGCWSNRQRATWIELNGGKAELAQLPEV